MAELTKEELATLNSLLAKAAKSWESPDIEKLVGKAEKVRKNLGISRRTFSRRLVNYAEFIDRLADEGGDCNTRTYREVDLRLDEMGA